MITYIPIVVGIWLVVQSLVMHTRNVTSALYFKVIPFFLGLASLYVGLKLAGVV